MWSALQMYFWACSKEIFLLPFHICAAQPDFSNTSFGFWDCCTIDFFFRLKIPMPRFEMASTMSWYPTLSTEELGQSNSNANAVAANPWGGFLCPRAWVKTARFFAQSAISHGGGFGYCWPKIELVTWGKNKKENKSLCIALPYPRGIRVVLLSLSLLNRENLASNSKMLSPEMFW